MVKEQKLALSAAVVLALFGGVCLFLRLVLLQGNRPTRGQSTYRVTYDIEIPRLEGLRVNIAVPSSTDHCRVFRESFSHHGLWMDMVKNKRTKRREAVVVPVAGFPQGRFSADFDIHLSRGQQWKKPANEGELTSSDLVHYLRPESKIQLAAPVVSEILARLKADARTKRELLEAIYEYCQEHIIGTEPHGTTDAAETLQYGHGTGLGHVRAMIALCRAAKIPARLVCGFAVESTSDPQPHFWLEARVKNDWCPYDPVCGYRAQLPPNFLPIRYDDTRIIRGLREMTTRTRFSISRVFPGPVASMSTPSGWPTITDLTRLSPGMQAMVALVLLLPIGALVTAVLHNLVGVRTYGTFTPALLALSFVQTDWRTGIVVLPIVLGVGILTRLLLNRLKLLMVPRLGVILCLVVATIITAVSCLDYLGMTPTASAVLLPMVILTMMVERFSITAEEHTSLEAIKVLIGTLLTAACCLAVLRQECLRYFILLFPETIFFVAAVLILLGRYSGYRLIELWRFRDLVLRHGEERS